jgi:PKD repeat protein
MASFKLAAQANQELLYPHANHVSNAASDNFRWNRNPNIPNQYRFQLSLDSSFVTTLIDDTTSAGFYTVNTLGPSNSIYFWRVKSLNPASPWSWIRKYYFFNPNNLNGLVAWLDPSNGVSLAGSSVMGMSDQGIFNNNAFQSAAVQRPIFVVSDSIMNNQSSIKYDGSNDFLEISDSPSLDFTTEFTAHALVKPSVIAINKTILAKWDYQTQGSWVWQTEFATADEYMFTPCFTITDPGNQKVVSTNADMVVNKPALMTLTYNANTQERATYHKNFLLLNTSTVGSIPQYLPNSTATLKVGKYGGTATRYYQGDITEVLLFNNAQTDSIRNLVDNYLRFKYCPPVNLGPDTLISTTGNCGFIQLKAGYRFSTYLWSTGSTASRIFVTQPGKYWVTVTDFMGGISKDTIEVKPPYDFNVPSTNVLCQGQSMVWATNFPSNNYSFLWQNGSTSPSMTITQPGSYHVKVTDNNGCFVRSDTLIVTLDTYPTSAFIGADTSLCIGNTLGLQVGANSTVQYHWSDGSTNSTYTVTNPGTYNVSLNSTNSNGCQAQDTITITVAGYAPQVTLNLPQSVCTNAPVQISCIASVPAPGSVQSSQWSFSNGTNFSGNSLQFSAPNAGILQGTLTVTAQDNCATILPLSLTVNVPPNLGISHSGSCSNAPVTFQGVDSLGSNLADFSWNFNQGGGIDTIPSPGFVFQTSGSVSTQLIAGNINGCLDTLLYQFSLFAAPNAAFATSNVCEQSNLQLVNTSSSNDTSSLVAYAWNFGDGNVSSLTAPYHAYSQEGTYLVSLVCTASNSCSDTLIQSLNIVPKPDLTWVVGPSCRNNITVFESQSTIPSGSVDSTSWLVNLQFPFNGISGSYVFTTLGIQYLQLFAVSDLGCTRDTLILVDVQPGVNSAFNYEPMSLLAGDTLILSSQSSGQNSQSWWINQQSIGNESNVQFAVADSLEGQTLEAMLVAQNALGCTDTSVVEIQVNERILEMEVKQVFYSEINGLTQVGVELVNLGTVPITRAQLYLSLSGQELYSSYFDETILPGNSYFYVFPSSPNFSALDQNETGDYYCVTADLEPYYTLKEVDLTNNKTCAVLENQTFELGVPTPNPANDQTNITLVVNQQTTLNIEIVNTLGQKINRLLNNQVFEPGTYQISIDMTAWASGNYFIRGINGEISKIYRIIKNED